MSNDLHEPHKSGLPNYHPIETEGFPWTGLTLVLVVLGLIAFMAVPTGPVSPEGRAAERLETGARIALNELRAAIRDYHLDHRDFPGTNPRALTTSEVGNRWFERQLTLSTDDAGNPAPGESIDHPHGPYLPAGVPANPVNALTGVMIVDSPEAFAPDDSTGWIFFRERGEIRLNSTTQLRGSSTRYFDL